MPPPAREWGSVLRVERREAKLHAQAALFTATSGTLSGHVFAVIDANGIAGYQAGADLVIELVDPVTPIDPTAGIIL